jgi:hypothetical protein
VRTKLNLDLAGKITCLPAPGRPTATFVPGMFWDWRGTMTAMAPSIGSACRRVSRDPQWAVGHSIVVALGGNRTQHQFEFTRLRAVPGRLRLANHSSLYACSLFQHPPVTQGDVAIESGAEPVSATRGLGTEPLIQPNFQFHVLREAGGKAEVHDPGQHTPGAGQSSKSRRRRFGKAHCRGSPKWNTDPWPSWLVTPRLPPWASTIALAIARPMPVPCTR